MGMTGSRLHIPGHRFVVVSDPAVLPDIIGRPGLPKWAAYENVIPVSTCPSWHSTCPILCPGKHTLACDVTDTINGLCSWSARASATPCSQRHTQMTPCGRLCARRSTLPSAPLPSSRVSPHNFTLANPAAASHLLFHAHLLQHKTDCYLPCRYHAALCELATTLSPHDSNPSRYSVLGVLKGFG